MEGVLLALLAVVLVILAAWYFPSVFQKPDVSSSSKLLGSETKKESVPRSGQTVEKDSGETLPLRKVPSFTGSILSEAAVSVASSSSSDYALETDENSLDPMKHGRDNLRRSLGAPEFPYLKVTNELKNSSPDVIFPNTTEVQVVESKYISAKILMILRLKNHSGKDVTNYKFYEDFFVGKKRAFEIHMQFTLKQKPRGEIYLGGELPSSMKLGLVTKNLTRALMSVTNRLAPHAHASMGDKNIKTGEEDEIVLPHIVFPLRMAATHFIVTRGASNEPLPELGNLPPKDPEKRAWALKHPVDLDAGDTVTFSLNSMYIDFIKWRLVNLGPVRDVSLTTFWDRMPLSIVVYDLPSGDTSEKKKLRHENQQKRYYLNFRMTNTLHSVKTKKQLDLFHLLGSGEENINDSEINGTDRSFSSETMERIILPERKLSSSKLLKLNSLRFLATVMVCTNKRKWHPLLKTKQKRKWKLFFAVFRKDSAGKISMFLQHPKSFQNQEAPEVLKTLTRIAESEGLYKPLVRESFRSEADCALISAEDSTTVNKNLLEEKVASNLLNHRTPTGFGIKNLKKSISVLLYNVDPTDVTVVFESSVLFVKHETTWLEAFLVAFTVKNSREKMIMLFEPESKIPFWILSGNEVCTSYIIPNSEGITTEHPPFSLVFPTVELSTQHRVFFFGFKTNERARGFHLLFQNFNSSSSLVYEKPNFLGKFHLRGRSVNSVQKKIKTNLKKNRRISRIFDTPPDTHDLYLKLKLSVPDAFLSSFVDIDYNHSKLGRRILNVKKLNFGACATNELFLPNLGLPDSNISEESSMLRKIQLMKSCVRDANAPFFRRSRETQGNSPLRLSMMLLGSAKALLEVEQEVDSAIRAKTISQKMNEFAGDLRFLDLNAVSQLSEVQRKAFFLNLYHCLRLHSTFVFGAPQSIFDWFSFGLHCYNIGGTLFSLMDIEHQILKKPFSKIKIGTNLMNVSLNLKYNSSVYCKALAMKEVDLNIMFCLNCGTKSCLKDIPIFGNNVSSEGDASLDSVISVQMRQYSKRYLQEFVVADRASKEVRFPRVCHWHRKEFKDEYQKLFPAADQTRSDGYKISKVLSCLTLSPLKEDLEYLISLKRGNVTFRVRKFHWSPNIISK